MLVKFGAIATLLIPNIINVNSLIVLYYGPAILSHFYENQSKPILSKATLILVNLTFLLLVPDHSKTTARTQCTKLKCSS